MIIAQSTASALYVRFLQINAVAEFLVPCDLISHAHFDVFPFVSLHALRTKLLAKLPGQFFITCEKTRLKHCGFCLHITIGLSDRFLDRACGMSNLEAAVPEQVKDLLHHFLKIRRNFLCSLPVQKHDVDVAKWIELATAISAQANQCQRRPRTFFSVERGDRSEDVLQQNIDKLCAPRANFTAAAAGLMLQTQTVLFNLQKFFVKREDVCGSSCPDSGKLIFRMCQNFLEMTGHHHLELSILDLRLANGDIRQSAQSSIA